MPDFLKCALRNLGRKRIRTLLTILSIAIGVCSVVIIGSIGESGKEMVNAELDNLGLGGLSICANFKTGPAEVTAEHVNTIKKYPSVEAVMPLMLDYSEINIKDAPTQSIICGIDSGAKQVISLELLHGRVISRADVGAGANVCMVDETLAKSVYKRSNIVGKAVKVLVDNSYEDFTVIGVVAKGSNVLQNIVSNYVPSFIYMPYTTFQRMSGRSGFDQIAVRIKDGEDIDKASASILTGLNRSVGEKDAFSAENLAKQKDRMGNILNIVTMVLSGIGAISVVVAGLGIMTVMLVSVSERTREIGIKKAIGAGRKTIMAEFMLEALAISIIGSIAGAVIGTVLSVLAALPFGIHLGIEYALIFQCMAFCVLIGVIFGVYPAIKASRLSPVDALRYE